MPKSAYVTALDEIQLAMTAFLNPLGFRRSGRTYNRAVEDELVQVVGLQMGEIPLVSTSSRAFERVSTVVSRSISA